MDSSILEYLQPTRSRRSRGDHVEKLLCRVILDEQPEALAQDAAEFFGATGKMEGAERKAFSQARLRSLTRDAE